MQGILLAYDNKLEQIHTVPSPTTQLENKYNQSHKYQRELLIKKSTFCQKATVLCPIDIEPYFSVVLGNMST